MLENYCVSVIVPFYNAESHLERCIDVLLKQDFDMPYEVIMIDDASTDNSQNIIKNQNSPLIKLRSLSTNSGPSAARNIGLKFAKGEYVFCLDADDTIPTNTLKTLYSNAKENDFDLVYNDVNLIENSQNQRENIFVHQTDKIYSNNDITESIKERIFNPLYLVGLIGIQGKLIKRSIISQNNISFEEGLRYMEDEVFAWDVLAHCQNAKYIQMHLYSYYINPNVSSAVSAAFDHGFSVSNLKLAKSHIQNCFKLRGLSAQEAEKLADHTFIFCIISMLISYSRSILLGKVILEYGEKTKRKIIKDLLKDPDVSKAIGNYSPTKDENQWIPRAIKWKSSKLLEIACNRRAREILNIRRKKQRA